MSNYFSLGDWSVILLYLLGIIGLGLWFGKDHGCTDHQAKGIEGKGI